VRRKDKEITDPRKIEAVLKKAEIIQNAREKKQAADVLMDHYLGEEDKGRKHKYGKCMKDVCMVKIEIDSMTGKQTLPAQPD
jgi:nitroimidazol reductase NimA-like FMN-containing flavoprotein (pyridoxamine 5'-phosphate oxidase superfamily)